MYCGLGCCSAAVAQVRRAKAECSSPDVSGQVPSQYRAANGAVTTGSTPFVEYTYSSPANGSRLTCMVYPDNISFAADIGTGPDNISSGK